MTGAAEKFTPGEGEDYKRHRRFDRFARLVGDAAMARLAKSHVMVVGLGGVGSWAAESLARSGVGTLTIVDFDKVCVTNANRQLHALSSTGLHKADAPAERLNMINPDMRVRPCAFLQRRIRSRVFGEAGLRGGCHRQRDRQCRLLTFCREQGIPVVCSTGSGGRCARG